VLSTHKKVRSYAYGFPRVPEGSPKDRLEISDNLLGNRKECLRVSEELIRNSEQFAFDSKGSLQVFASSPREFPSNSEGFWRPPPGYPCDFKEPSAFPTHP